MTGNHSQERRSQASTEYLIILAVVVIVALAVVGVLGGFPTVSKGISEKDSATYWQSSDIGIIRYNSSSAGTWGILRNNKNFAIVLTSSTGTGDNIPGAGITMAPGESTTIFYLLSTVNGAKCATPGVGTYAVPVSELGFGYRDLTYGTTYNFTGIKPLVGSC